MPFPNRSSQFKPGQSGNPGGRRKIRSSTSFDGARLDLADAHCGSLSIRSELSESGSFTWILRCGKVRTTGASIREVIDKFADKINADLTPEDPVEFRAYMFRRSEDDYKKSRRGSV